MDVPDRPDQIESTDVDAEQEAIVDGPREGNQEGNQEDADSGSPGDVAGDDADTGSDRTETSETGAEVPDSQVDLPSEAPPPPPDPSAFPGLELWLDAARLKEGPLTTWPDRSGHGHDAAPLVGRGPAALVDEVTALVTVDMQTVEDVMTISGDFADFTQGLSAFVVVFPRVSYSTVPNEPAAYTHFLEFGRRFGVHENSVLIQRSGDSEGQLGFYVYLEGENADGFLANEVVGNYSWQLFEVVMNPGAPGTSTTGRSFRNGSPIGSGTIYVPNVVSRTSNLIGGSNYRTPDGKESDGHFRGRIGEVVLFKRVLDDQERKKLRLYLLSKWRIASDQSPS